MNTSLGLLQSVGIGLVAVVLVAVVGVVLFVLVSAVKIVKEYERGVIFRLGRVQGRAKGPGLFILIPAVDRMVKVGLRTVTLDVPPQDLITRDNVPARVTAVIYFRVVDPNKSVIKIENHVLATSQISQTTLRSVLGQKNLDDLLTNREAINEELQRIIDEQTEPWGIKVSVVEVKDVEIPQNMQRAMARQASRRQAREPAGAAAPALPDYGRDRYRTELDHHPAHPAGSLPTLPERARRDPWGLQGEGAAGEAGGRGGGRAPL